MCPRCNTFYRAHNTCVPAHSAHRMKSGGRNVEGGGVGVTPAKPSTRQVTRDRDTQMKLSFTFQRGVCTHFHLASEVTEHTDNH